MIKAVCFDMDGVLFDTEPLGGVMLHDAALLQDCDMTEEQAASLIGANMKTTRESLNRWFPGKIDAPRFVSDWCRLMLERLRRDGMPFKPHAAETLRNLRLHGYKLALCTSNASEVVAEYLRLAGLENAFDEVITGDLVAHGKPAPDIYLLGAEKLGVAPGDCVGVEDSFNGVRAVRAAGMTCVMIPDTLPYGEVFAPYVDLLLSDLSELENAMLTKE